jgi:hypothetical protein
MTTGLDEAREGYGNGYYAQKLEQGRQFQDHVTRLLYAQGVVLVGYGSRAFQLQHGENILGAEIKRDDKFRSTGNLYIETAEKAHPDRPSFTPSGIMRDDNQWLFVIGDERDLWIFGTKTLRLLVESKRWSSVETPTSRGYLMPLADAERYCIKRIST